jgi:hypothetical protein
MAEKARNSAQSETKDLKVKLSTIEEDKKTIADQMSKLKEQLMAKDGMIEKERTAKREAEINLKLLEKEQKIGGNVGQGSGGMSYDALMARNRELEADNRILEQQKELVVARNKENGNFEYIGEPIALQFEGQVQIPTSVDQVLGAIKKWLSKNDRLTWKSVLRACDKGDTGELREADFVRAFAKLGISFSRKDLDLLQGALDKGRAGLYKYEPLILRLEGVPVMEFLQPEFEKLAVLMLQKDMLENDLLKVVNPRMSAGLTLESFRQNIKALRGADFELSDVEIDQLFKCVAGRDRLTSRDEIEPEKFITKVYDAVQAQMLFRIKRCLTNSRKFLVDLITAHDANRDGFLTHKEVDSLLFELQVGLKPKVTQNILIAKVLDPRNTSKVAADRLKMLVGDR